MKKKYFLCVFAVILFFTGFLFGNSPVNAAETDTSNVTYNYINISTLTETQKIVLSKEIQTRHLQMIMKIFPLCIKKTHQNQLQI